MFEKIPHNQMYVVGILGEESRGRKYIWINKFNIPSKFDKSCIPPDRKSLTKLKQGKQRNHTTGHYNEITENQ